MIATVASIWKKYAIRLHFEAHDILRIEQDSRLQSVSASQQMMMEWLNGKGRQPTTWATVIEALEECELSQIAKDVKGALTEINIET